MTRTADVVIIGGGPAGAVTAAYLARAGHDVILVERSPAWRWRAGGVFSSPAAVRELRPAGLAPEGLARASRPIPAMRVELPDRDRTAFGLTYGAETTGETAVGFDRSVLDPALLEHAAAVGVEVRCGIPVTRVELRDHRQGASVTVGRTGPAVRDAETIGAQVIVGADGPRSIVAVEAGMVRAPRLANRVALSWHVADEPDDPSKDARMVVLPGGAYCGIAPVPGGRVNIGIVLAGGGWRTRLQRDGAAAVGRDVFTVIPRSGDAVERW